MSKVPDVRVGAVQQTRTCPPALVHSTSGSSRQSRNRSRSRSRRPSIRNGRHHHFDAAHTFGHDDGRAPLLLLLLLVVLMQVRVEVRRRRGRSVRKVAYVRVVLREARRVRHGNGARRLSERSEFSHPLAVFVRTLGSGVGHHTARRAGRGTRTGGGAIRLPHVVPCVPPCAACRGRPPHM